MMTISPSRRDGARTFWTYTSKSVLVSTPLKIKISVIPSGRMKDTTVADSSVTARHVTHSLPCARCPRTSAPSL